MMLYVGLLGPHELGMSKCYDVQRTTRDFDTTFRAYLSRLLRACFSLPTYVFLSM